MRTEYPNTYKGGFSAAEDLYKPERDKLRKALERRVVDFSMDRILCRECSAFDSGSIQDMEIHHASNCVLAGVITQHPSRHEGE